MKRSFLPVLLMVLFSTTLFGQSAKKVLVPIYEHGNIIYSCESNFDNLLKNWKADNIANAADYVIQGYVVVETMEDSATYNLYARYFASDKALNVVDKNTGRFPAYDNEATKLSPEPKPNSTVTLQDFKKRVNLGDLVYAVLFRYKGTLYTNYVVCSSESRTVSLDPFFGNIKIWVNEK
jgi:hypothetical protein